MNLGLTTKSAHCSMGSRLIRYVSRRNVMWSVLTITFVQLTVADLGAVKDVFQKVPADPRDRTFAG